MADQEHAERDGDDDAAVAGDGSEAGADAGEQAAMDERGRRAGEFQAQRGFGCRRWRRGRDCWRGSGCRRSTAARPQARALAARADRETARGTRARSSSGSRPIAEAYARMNDRRKMPDGQRETSPRSSASNSDALILVLAEIDSSAICRRSRSRRRRTHQDGAGMLSSETIAMPTLGASLIPAQRPVMPAFARIISVHVYVGIARCR